VLGILTGDRLRLQPPVAGFMESLDARAQDGINDFLAAAVVGGPDTVRAGFERVAELTAADEFILVSDVYDPELRLRSISIASEANRAMFSETAASL